MFSISNDLWTQLCIVYNFEKSSTKIHKYENIKNQDKDRKETPSGINLITVMMLNDGALNILLES